MNFYLPLHANTQNTFFDPCLDLKRIFFHPIATVVETFSQSYGIPKLKFKYSLHCSEKMSRSSVKRVENTQTSLKFHGNFHSG